MATSRLCSVPDCSKPIYGFDYCRNHYRRLKTHGNPLAGGTPRGEPLEWIRQHVLWSGLDCLNWPFGKHPYGYGSIKYRGIAMGAHRAMCFEAHGEPTAGSNFAAHSCGNGHLGCVNPNHLRWATPEENHADIALHGSRKGERHNKAKLTREDVRQIRSLEGQISRREIGKLYGVSGEAIAGIHSGRSWGWLPPTRL